MPAVAFGSLCTSWGNLALMHFFRAMSCRTDVTPPGPVGAAGRGGTVVGRPNDVCWPTLQSGGRMPALHDQQPMGIFCREIRVINRALVARNLIGKLSRALARAARAIPTLVPYLPRVRVLSFESFSRPYGLSQNPARTDFA